jgi:hypothetical protein
MKQFFYSGFCLIASLAFAQRSEDLIPHEAVTVFSINNFTLLQKIPMDEMVKYEFMEEVQQELFDGSTSGKTLKDSGIDFEEKLHVFYGLGTDYEVSGFAFGIKNKTELFQVFDDFEPIPSPYRGIEFYGSYFNNLIVQNNLGLLVRIEPTMSSVDAMTDSIWYSRGNASPWEGDYSGDFDFEEEEGIFDTEIDGEGPPSPPEIDLPPPPEEDMPIDIGAAEEDELSEKNYYELRDSVQLVMQQDLLRHLCEELLVKKYNLKQQDERFTELLTHQSEGTFYLDNSRNVQNQQGLWYFQTMFPSLYNDMKELYSGNVLLGDLLLNADNVQFKMEARYGPTMGSIYEKMNHAKFDKQVLNYIHKDNSAYFTYNINLRQAYEQAYKVVMPMLTDEGNPSISANVLTLELLNEFINKDALFGTYKGSLFGTFNGIKKIKTTKIEFDYNEETFEYTEREVEAEEDMPIFTIGFSTERSDIPEKILKHLSRLTSRFQNMGNYWVYEDAILDAAPLYMINRNGLFIFTNDEDLATYHSDGYGKNALTGKSARKSKKSGFMYANVNWGKAIDNFPPDFGNGRQIEIINAMRGKTGTMELTTTKTTKERTYFNLVYDYKGSYENSGKYLLDLLNSVYIISK